MGIPVISGYRIERLLGSGGMGVVYLGIQERVKRPVAIKILSDTLSHDPDLRRRFGAEAELMASLNHPGIVLLYDFMEHGDTLALIMEYIAGQTLDHMIGSEVGPIPSEKALPLFTQMLDAVAYAHGKNIIHRDLKPSNIIVTPEQRIKVTDFGIAKIAGQKGLTKTGAKVGTLNYMAPEVILGEEASVQSDIYSLSVTLYEMLAGQLPYSSDTSEFRIMQRIISEELPDPRSFYPHISESLVNEVRRGTSKDPRQRFQSCREFAEAVCGESTPLNRQQPSVLHPSPSNQTAQAVYSSASVPLAQSAGPLPGMQFVKIPGGSFMMGSPPEEKDRFDNESPVHKVVLKSFELLSTPVTQGMWEELMGKTPSYFKGQNNPVECVSWKDCQKFIDKLNKKNGSSHTYRLPSEAEWEYACRAGTITRYYWGNDPNSTEICQYAWYDGNSNSTTHPVAQKLPNAWGLYDMSGNVREWCEDWYHESYSGAPADGSPWVSPSGSYRVWRGGGWHFDAGGCRSSIRDALGPDYGNGLLGFRLARSVR